MNPSYVRMRRSLEDAMARYARWIGVPELEPPREVAERDAIDLALVDEQWKGLAVFVFPSGDWTVFEELSGGLGLRSAEDWVRLADGGDLVYAGYNDAIPYAQLLVIEAGVIRREFLEDEQEPGENVNRGALPEESKKRFATWVDVAGWVDRDDEELAHPARGLLWIHEGEFPA